MHWSNARRWTGAALLATVGVGLAGLVLFDVYQDWLVQGTSFQSTVAENVVPFAFSIAIPVVAGRLFVSDRDAAALVTVAKWTLVGLGSMLFLAGWVVGFQTIQGRINPWTIVVQMAVFGSVAGLVVGRVVERTRRRTEQLRQTETRYETLADAFPDYAYLYNTDGKYLDAILGWERADGRTYTTEELVGETVHDVFSEETAETILDAVREAAETGTIETTEYRVETPRGDRWFEGRATPIDESIDGEEAVLLAARDVTEQHELRQELESQNERLDRFARVVSHDLRNPLNVAQGHLGLVEAADGENHLETVNTALDRMESIIEGTLVLARQGETVSESEPVDLETVAGLCWGTVATADADLAVTESFEIYADVDRLRHLLENCFRNAIEHGGSAVSVKVGPIDEDGFYIADDGAGLPPEHEELFETGYTTGAEGTGLGLSIVQGIAEAHGWDVDVTESEAGGARFEITGVEHVDRPD